MQEGEKFSKTDLTKALLQVELDGESQKYLPTNTSRGLKQPTRMSYGVKPATGLFQRFIENALASISYAAVKFDNILISGKTDTNHSENLEKVFRGFKEIGATVNRNAFCQRNRVC